jgi:hypothetical protein
MISSESKIKYLCFKGLNIRDQIQKVSINQYPAACLHSSLWRARPPGGSKKAENKFYWVGRDGRIESQRATARCDPSGFAPLALVAKRCARFVNLDTLGAHASLKNKPWCTYP